MLSNRDRMEAVHTQCDGYIMNNEQLKRKVAELSVIRKVTSGTVTTKSEEELLRRRKIERKLSLLLLVLHLTHMDRKMCLIKVDVTDDKVFFLYSRLKQGTA